jgi:hypothetical protein
MEDARRIKSFLLTTERGFAEAPQVEKHLALQCLWKHHVEEIEELQKDEAHKKRKNNHHQIHDQEVEEKKIALYQLPT